ncbi:origin recognition complex subunit 3 N-terminus-domain-containing protein [Irpex rosettiformis]|uniref:Origin recognition complex subunit 3 N-terminus-domain-containing protein n=1 Tax=Irpex rosettiformis TaxID=378272 RepID=A0ACB8U1T9_9APHY|nr:origin recognition complex subunit 3 N-terminus-domain-containing protein [Irpex rosettiformis]
MSPTSDLDDPTKTCVYLPKPSSPSNNTRSIQVRAPKRRLNHGYDVQLEAYEVAWSRCLKRVQAVVRELQAPIVSAVKTSIDDAYSKDVLTGLPYTELPVVAVSAPGGSRSVISDVVALLEPRRTREGLQRGEESTQGKGKARMVEEDDEPTQTHSLVAHIRPGDCSNISNAMRAIILGFVDRHGEEEDGLVVQLPVATKRRPATSLAMFDIVLLKTWYRALSQLNPQPPQLVVVLHNFEQLDPSVMQDVFYICSKNIPHLPLVFLLDSSAPSTMTNLHAAYSRATIALLRVSVHTTPSGLDLANSVIEKVFFDPDFEPDVVLGFAALDFMAEFSSRHTASLDAILTMLQIIHIRHFESPLTSFVRGFDSEAALQETATRIRQTSSFSLIDSLLTRLWGESAPDGLSKELPEYLKGIPWSDLSLEALLSLLNSARNDFCKRAAHLRLGYQLVRVVQRFMRAQGYKTSPSVNGQEDSELTFMSRTMRGRVGRDVKHLALMVRKLHDNQLNALLGEMYSLFFRLQNTEVRQSETGAREFLVQARANITPQNATLPEDIHEAKKASAMGPSVSEWFLSYVEDRLTTLDQQPLWEIWSTGVTTFPSELINPAPRITMVNALLHPSDVVKAHRTLYASSELWELPDTSILFKRYMEAGRLINVYDLYESFAVVLETQKEKRAVPATPKRSEKGKKKIAEEDEEPQIDDEEKWTLEVHARFMRALHELDYMGFVKHTGRKPDHIFKTVYDVPD